MGGKIAQQAQVERVFRYLLNYRPVCLEESAVLRCSFSPFEPIRGGFLCLYARLADLTPTVDKRIYLWLNVRL